MASKLYMQQENTPPIYISVAHGYLQHKGAGSSVSHKMKGHVYSIQSGVKLKNVVAFPCGAF